MKLLQTKKGNSDSISQKKCFLPKNELKETFDFLCKKKSFILSFKEV